MALSRRTEVFAIGRDSFEASLWRWLGSEYFVQSVRQVLECGEFKHLPVKKERRSARDAQSAPGIEALLDPRLRRWVRDGFVVGDPAGPTG